MSTKIGDQSLYLAYYDATRRAVEAGNAPLTILRPGTKLVRAVNRLDQPISWLQARTIYKNSRSDDNRFSGIRFPNTPGPRDGGLYLSLDHRGNTAENFYYEVEKPLGRSKSRRDQDWIAAFDTGLVSPDLALFSKAQYIYELRAAISLVDITGANKETPMFLRSIEKGLGKSQDSVRGELLASDDYSAARAFSHAIRDAGSGIGGLSAPTARENRNPALKGDNVVLFGADGHNFTELAPIIQKIFVQDDITGNARVIRTQLSETASPLIASIT